MKRDQNALEVLPVARRAAAWHPSLLDAAHPDIGMAQTLFFITHPEVTVDAATPVTRWSLSDLGRRRFLALLEQGTLDTVSGIYSSTEPKALEAAELLAGRRGVRVNVMAELGEIDRSSTGYMDQTSLEAAADRFVERPTESCQGWETAAAAQQRIIAAVERILNEARDTGDTAVISHGAVGMLYKCHLKGVPINRGEDQPRQGHYYRIDKGSRRLLHDWIALPDA